MLQNVLCSPQLSSRYSHSTEELGKKRESESLCVNRVGGWLVDCVAVVVVGGMDGDGGNVRCSEALVLCAWISLKGFALSSASQGLIVTDTFFQETSMTDISTVCQGLQVILWLLVWACLVVLIHMSVAGLMISQACDNGANR